MNSPLDSIIAKEKSPGRGGVPSTDALARIGIYVGGAGLTSSLVRGQDRLIAELKASRKALQQMASREARAYIEW